MSQGWSNDWSWDQTHQSADDNGWNKSEAKEQAAADGSWGQTSWDSAKSWEQPAAPKQEEKPAGGDWANSWDSWAQPAAKQQNQYNANAAPAQDAWTSWAGGAQQDPWKAASNTQPVPNAKQFWAAQDWYKQQNTVPKKQDWELDEEEKLLFANATSGGGIDFHKYDDVAVSVSGKGAEIVKEMGIWSFNDIWEKFHDCTPPELVENVNRCKYTTPTPVQKNAVPAGLVGRDIMCCAQTGSGKTAAYLIPALGRMMRLKSEPAGGWTTPYEGPAKPSVLIIAPTRELCLQIYDESRKMTHRTPYRPCRVYGGEPPKAQLEDLARGCDLLVACPGRLQDFINRGVVNVSEVEVLILDEADRMLDMGFEWQIRDIINNHGMSSKEDRQTMMFSATFPEKCQQMAQDYLYDYLWVGVGIIGGAVDTVEQKVMKVEPSQKYEKLLAVLDEWYENRPEKQRALVFTNAKGTAKWLDEQLYDKNFDTGSLHGNLTQTERERNLARFRASEIDVMVATDVAARGLDIPGVDTVINYDMPTDIDTYVHRIGRTGRIGNRGTAITFISCDDYGTAVEHADTLRRLLSTMRDCGSEIPDWLEAATNGGGGDGKQDTNSWSNWDSNAGWDKWGSKDMRSQWGEPEYQ